MREPAPPHFPDIREWDESRIFDAMGMLWVDGFDIAHEPRWSRTDRTRAHLKMLYEQYAECVAELRRRSADRGCLEFGI